MPIDLWGSLQRGFASLFGWATSPGPSSENELLNSTRKEDSQNLNQSTHARNMTICSMFSKRFALPTEITEDILDKAESWICQFDLFRRDWQSLAQPTIVVNSHKIMAFSKSLELSEIRKLRRVRFTFVSQDQGWSDHSSTFGGTFDGSFSWWEMKIQRANNGVQADQTNGFGIEDTTAKRDDLCPKTVSSVSPVSPVPIWTDVQSLHLQNNRHAGEHMERYNIDVDNHYEVFEYLQPGDRIVLCACALYPGWQNIVEYAVMVLWFKDTLN